MNFIKWVNSLSARLAIALLLMIFCVAANSADPQTTTTTNQLSNNLSPTTTESPASLKQMTENLSNQLNAKQNKQLQTKQSQPQPQTVEEVKLYPQVVEVNKNSKYISFDFQKIETRTLLQLIAKTSGLNFIISDAVKGNMTLHVEDVTWEQALELILKANGLDSRRFGNTMLIAPIQELAQNEIQALQAKQKVAELAPLKSEIIRLNYANAKDIGTILQGQQGTLLSSRGSVSVDERTNSIWVHDVPAKLTEVQYFVKQLDYPARQVLIEAKIVSLEKNYERDLGIRWGVTNPNQNLSGTFYGANQLAQNVTPANITNSGGSVDPTQRLNFNMPASPTTFSGTPASIALALVSIGDRYLLDLELSALERERRAQTVSSPRIITSNQKTAMIEQGEEIPYLVASSSGATSVEFKKAVLSLKITPQITPDNNIILTIKVTQNTRGDQIVVNTQGQSSPLLPPAINTKEVESNVFLKNGDTIIIGGIYQVVSGNEVRRIPFLGTLPVVGALFRNNVKYNNKSEMVVFITPTIIGKYYQDKRAAKEKMKYEDY